MREFLKIELSAELRVASLRKTCKLLWQFGSKKFKLLGRLVAPQKQQAAGAPTDSDEFVSRRMRPISVALDRFFDCSNRVVETGAVLL